MRQNYLTVFIDFLNKQMIEQITWKNIYNMLLNEYIGVKKYRVHDSNFVRKINVYILSE